ncbi:MAG: nucleotidyltransferase [Flavobacteriales bacterium]|nr:nucleotidyltransferase [Flavobacteriales bacterium]
MKLNNTQLGNFINRIKLQKDAMPKYRKQIEFIKERLEAKINEDKHTGLRVSKYLLAGSWKKRTILRATGDHPIDIDLVLYVDGDEATASDMKKLHDFLVGYLEEIYPSKDISKDVDAEGNTKSIKITFTGTGLELDIVPVVALASPKDYVWQPARGGSDKKYITSVTKQLDFASTAKEKNPNYTSIVRALKWWRNYKELKPDDDNGGLSSFAIELIVAYLDTTHGLAGSIEEGIIRFFQAVSAQSFPVIKFAGAINTVPAYTSAVFIADPTNNENNAAKKVDADAWAEIRKQADDAFESLNIAQAKNYEGETVDEWKRVFGPSFNITES